MASETEHHPGDLAPETGTYRLLDIFGSRTATHVHVRQGHPLPGAPRGHTWRLEREPGDLE
jgi:hypothetical protein